MITATGSCYSGGGGRASGSRSGSGVTRGSRSVRVSDASDQMAKVSYSRSPKQHMRRLSLSEDSTKSTSVSPSERSTSVSSKVVEYGKGDLESLIDVSLSPRLTAISKSSV